MKEGQRWNTGECPFLMRKRSPQRKWRHRRARGLLRRMDPKRKEGRALVPRHSSTGLNNSMVKEEEN